MSVGVQHHEEQRVVGLNLHELRIAGGQQRFEESESLRPMLRQDIELEQRWLVLPRTGNGHRAEACGRAAGLEPIGQRPAGPPMNRVVNNLAVHFLARAFAKRKNLWCGSQYGSGWHRRTEF